MWLAQTRRWRALPPSTSVRLTNSASKAKSATGFTRLSRDYGVAGIALGRELNDDASVDVLGTQLEEVVE
jgi:hypothetical protein